MLIDDLLSRRENIREAMEQGTFVLLICGGYQLFGQYYISADNEKIEGLKFLDVYKRQLQRSESKFSPKTAAAAAGKRSAYQLSLIHIYRLRNKNNVIKTFR